MPFYGKPTLQRVYHTWNSSKRKHLDRYIEVAYGKTFLDELKKKLRNKHGKSSSQGNALSQSQRTESASTTQRKFLKMKGTDKEGGYPKKPGQNLQRPQSQGRGDAEGPLVTSQKKDKDAAPVTRRRGQRRTSGLVSSILGSKEVSSSTPKNRDESEKLPSQQTAADRDLMSQDSVIEDENSSVVQTDQDTPGINVTKRPLRSIPKTRKRRVERRDNITEEDGSLQTSALRTSQDVVQRGVTPAEAPKSDSGNVSRLSQASEAIQSKKDMEGINRVGGKRTEDRDPSERNLSNQFQAEKMVADDRSAPNPEEVTDLTLENQDLRVTALNMSHQSSEEKIDKEKASVVTTRKDKQRPRLDRTWGTVKTAQPKNDAPQTSQTIPVQKQCHKMGGRKKRPKRGNLTEKSCYTRTECSSEADGKRSGANVLGGGTNTADVADKRTELEPKSSEVSYCLGFHKIQPLNIDAGSTADSSHPQPEATLGDESHVLSSQWIVVGQTRPDQRVTLRKRRKFSPDPRTRRAHQKFESQRDTPDFDPKDSRSAAETNKMSKQQPRRAVETETKVGSDVIESDLVEQAKESLSPCPSQESPVVSRKSLRLRQTARKSCPQPGKSTKDGREKTSCQEANPFSSSPAMDQMTAFSPFGRRLSVEIFKMEESVIYSPIQSGEEHLGQKEPEEKDKEAKSTHVSRDSGVQGEGINLGEMHVQITSTSMNARDGNAMAEDAEQDCATPTHEVPETEELTEQGKGGNSVKESIHVKHAESNHLRVGNQEMKLGDSEQQEAGTSEHSQPEMQREGNSWQSSCDTRALAAVGLISKRQDFASQVGLTISQDLNSDCDNPDSPSSASHEVPATGESREHPSSGNEEDENGSPGRSGGALESASSSVADPRRKKMFDTFDENLWNLAVVARIEDVPLMEDDEGVRKSPVCGETETPRSSSEGGENMEKSQQPPQEAAHESQEETHLDPEFSPVEQDDSTRCNKDANSNDTSSDSNVSDSVKDEEGISPGDNPLPGLSNLHCNPPQETLPQQRNPSLSLVLDTVPQTGKKKKQLLGRIPRTRERSSQGKSLEKQQNPRKDSNLKPRETSQEAETIEDCTPRLRQRHRNRSIAMVTKDNQPAGGENMTQTAPTIETKGNASVAPRHQDTQMEDIIPADGVKFTDAAIWTTTAADRAPQKKEQKEPGVQMRIRTAAEKKQGWSSCKHQAKPFCDAASAGGGAVQDTPFETASFKMTPLDQQPALTSDQDETNSATRQTSRKRKRNEPPEDRVRGQSGWEESLRQKPATVNKFQAGDSPEASKKPESAHEKRRWQSPVKSMTSTPVKSDSAKTPLKEKVSFRDVWKPPPAKKLKLDAEDHPQKVYDEEGPKKSASSQVPPESSRQPVALQDKFRYGELIWGKMKGFNWWPGRVIHHHTCSRDPAASDACWVTWFGDDKYSKLNLNQVTPFAEFSHFSSSTFLHTALYRKAVFQALRMASTRASKTYSSDPNEYKSEVPKRSRHSDPAWQKFYDLCNEMIDWAKDGFGPSGHDAIMPSEEEQQPPPRPPSQSPPPSPMLATPTKRTSRSPSKASSTWKDIRVRGKSGKLPEMPQIREKVGEFDWFKREIDTVMEDVRNGTKCIEDVCIGCGSSALTAQHPFFVGGLCEVCRIEFLEVAYVFDEDGYQSFCCICAEGKEVVLCDQMECYRSFCHDCMDYLVGPGTVQTVLAQDHWRCYMCDPEPTNGLLSRRADWPQKLLLFFQQDCGQNFPPLRTYPPVDMDQRKPIRVLSLFDGIGTGMLVLKELGIKVDCYYASEINEEARQVSSVRHDGIIKQLDDIRYITEQVIKSLGPFDLVLGGSPCNDLSIANPGRKGLFEGTGRLFFEYYRLLSASRPQEDCDHPFFWLFENVVGMSHKDKMDISRFLQCDPVIVDAKDVSPAHRARYFWGNLPGMNRPNVATDNNALSLQECLEPNCNRQAQFAKVRTVTSKLNSIKQKNEQVLPVLMNGQEDALWCTEMERIFGFPEHYTDLANMSRSSRHRLIGQAWSVPVIKHLLAPLKEYFACETHQ